MKKILLISLIPIVLTGCFHKDRVVVDRTTVYVAPPDGLMDPPDTSEMYVLRNKAYSDENAENGDLINYTLALEELVVKLLAVVEEYKQWEASIENIVSSTDDAKIVKMNTK